MIYHPLPGPIPMCVLLFMVVEAEITAFVVIFLALNVVSVAVRPILPAVEYACNGIGPGPIGPGCSPK